MNVIYNNVIYNNIKFNMNLFYQLIVNLSFRNVKNICLTHYSFDTFGRENYWNELNHLL